jgi:hypothetical protein
MATVAWAGAGWFGSVLAGSATIEMLLSVMSLPVPPEQAVT